MRLKGSSDPISYKEIAKYSDENDPKKLFDFVFFGCSTRKIDEKIFCFVFRQIKPFLNGFLNSSSNGDEHVDFDAMRALSRLILSSDFDFDVFLAYFTENGMVQAFENLRAPHKEVKEASKLLIECIYKKFRESSSILREIIANELLMFHAGLTNPRDMEFIFRMLRSIVINNDLGSGVVEYYEQFVLPSINIMPYAGCDSMYMLFEAFCSHSTKCQKLSLRFFVKSFSRLDSVDHIKLMEMTTRILHIYFFKESTESLDEDFSEMLNLGLKSESYLVIDAVMNMLNDDAVKRFIEVNVKSVLPRVFESLYRLSKRFWRLEQRCKAIQAIGSILSMDNNVFEDCLIEYNKTKYHRRYSTSELDDERVFNEKIKKMQSVFNE